MPRRATTVRTLLHSSEEDVVSTPIVESRVQMSWADGKPIARIRQWASDNWRRIVLTIKRALKLGVYKERN